MVEQKVSTLRKVWLFLCKPSAKYPLLALLAVGVIGGVVFAGGAMGAIEQTNRLEFCISCHEMRDTVYQEYKQSIHYQNKFGVRAACPDCHVPKELGHMVVRKMKASKEIWGKVTGKVDTPAKFEQHRMELATDEWARMKANGSRECRNCHDFKAMDASKQKPSAQLKHAEAQAKGLTCIDCHKGIAHLLPKEYVDPTEEE